MAEGRAVTEASGGITAGETRPRRRHRRRSHLGRLAHPQRARARCGARLRGLKAPAVFRAAREDPAMDNAGPSWSGSSQRRPPWLRIRLRTPECYHEVRRLVESQRLHTVCEEARCPNIYECWGEHGTATFMILGDVCTRRCGFCAVTTGKPRPGVDADEPARVAEAVAAMGLRHAVITSVDRDDLADGGAGHFADVIAAVRERNPDARSRC